MVKMHGQLNCSKYAPPKTTNCPRKSVPPKCHLGGNLLAIDNVIFVCTVSDFQFRNTGFSVDFNR